MNLVKKDKQLRVLQIIPELHMGGVERAVLETSEALVQSKHKAFVLSSGGKLLDRLTKMGVIHFTHNVKTKNPLKLMSNIFYMKKLFKAHAIDLVHVRSRAPAWSAYFACKMAGVKMVSTLHGVYESHNWFQRFYAGIMMKADAVIAVSHFVKNYSVKAFGWEASRIEVIQNGIDPEHFFLGNVNLSEVLMLKSLYGIEEGACVILMPARASSSKGHLFLLEALAHIHKPVHVLFLGIEGASGYVQSLQEKAKQLEGQHFIHFIPPQQNVLSYYVLASCVALPSLSLESFGRGALEAAAFERIALAPRQGGFCETIVDEKTGFLFEPLDSLDLASQIRRVFDMTSSARQKMGERARAHAQKNFLLKNTLKNTIALYRRVVLG